MNCSRSILRTATCAIATVSLSLGTAVAAHADSSDAEEPQPRVVEETNSGPTTQVEVGGGLGVYIYLRGDEAIAYGQKGVSGSAAALCSAVGGGGGAFVCGISAELIYEALIKTPKGAKNTCFEFTQNTFAQSKPPKQVSNKHCTTPR